MTNVRIECVTDDVFLVGGTAVNWTIVREGRALTLVDSGYPGDAEGLVESIDRIGHRPADVAGVLVTHGHVDHIGGLPEFLRRHSPPVYAHPLELDLVRGQISEQAGPWDLAPRMWRPRYARWTFRAVRAGAGRRPEITDVAPLPGDGPLDLPGQPVPVPCGGHTTGHTAYHLPGAGILLSGDALVTGHPLTGRTGPQLLPGFFASDPHQAFATLDALAGLAADTLVPGHGPPWRGDLGTAISAARTSAPREYTS